MGPKGVGDRHHALFSVACIGGQKPLFIFLSKPDTPKDNEIACAFFLFYKYSS
jgi:hypothetical protein